MGLPSSVYKDGGETTHEIHVLNVYKDLEFIQDVSMLALDHRKNLMINIQMAKIRNKTNGLRFEDITKKYCITGR